MLLYNNTRKECVEHDQEDIWAAEPQASAEGHEESHTDQTCYNLFD